MVRILEVITLGEIGGAQTVLADLMWGISERGFEGEIDVVFGPGSYLPQALSSWPHGKVIQSGNFSRSINPFKDFLALGELIQLCKKRKYDIVHCHSSKASWLGRLAASLASVPQIYMTVHGLPFHPGNSRSVNIFYKAIEKMAIPLASKYIFVSPPDVDQMQQLGLDASKVTIIPNGRPIPKKPTKGLRDTLSIPVEAPLICMVARVSDIKKPQSFVKIAKIVQEKYQHGPYLPHFVLIGDGPLFDQVRSLACSAGLTGTVHLLGHQDNASEFFWEADLALLTSNYEACPLVAIEAMATGTPLVASNVGGTGHLVKHGETGYLFAPHDEEAAAKYIISLLENRQLREHMSIAAFSRYQGRFTVETMVEHYMDLFNLKTKARGGVLNE